MTFRILVRPLICLVAMGFAFVEAELSIYIFVAILFFYFSQQTVYSFLQKEIETSDA